jgi:type I restriction enzyme S subunit
MSGTAGQQRVGTDIIKNYLVPLPPLEEQKRIVAKIEEMIPYCKQLIK